jgi:hypothetical protein
LKLGANGRYGKGEDLLVISSRGCLDNGLDAVREAPFIVRHLHEIVLWALSSKGIEKLFQALSELKEAHPGRREAD